MKYNTLTNKQMHALLQIFFIAQLITELEENQTPNYQARIEHQKQQLICNIKHVYPFPALVMSNGEYHVSIDFDKNTMSVSKLSTDEKGALNLLHDVASN